MLADLLLDAGPKAYPAFLSAAQSRQVETLPLFQAEIAKRPTHDWNDPPLDASWAELDSTARSRIEAAGGLVAERFAFCQTMPLDEFLTTAEGLRKSGYRPVRCRPYADGQVVKVAAVWTRDGREWRIASGLAADELRTCDEELRQVVHRSPDLAFSGRVSRPRPPRTEGLLSSSPPPNAGDLRSAGRRGHETRHNRERRRRRPFGCPEAHAERSG